MIQLIATILLAPMVIAYPYYVLLKKGYFEGAWHVGVVFGFNFSKTYFEAKVKNKGEDDSQAVLKQYIMRSFQYHLLFWTFTMGYSREKK